MKVKAVSREPVSRPGGALALQGGEEVRNLKQRAYQAAHLL
jgi:hypothetical protein